MSTEVAELSVKRRWFIATIVYLVMLAAFCNQFKAPPLFTTLIPALHFNGGNIGLMMSMFSFLGILLAFPAAFIISKIGIKKTLVITAIGLAIGSFLGALAQNATTMLISRLIEGSGVGLLSVVAPSALAAVIPKKQRGLAFGIQGITFPAGTVVGLNAAPALAAAFGWRSVWLVGGALAVIVGLLTLAFFALPANEDRAHAPEAAGAAAGSSSSLRPDYRSIIVTGIVFLIWNIIWAGAFNSFYPTFLQKVHGLTPGTSSFIVSVTSLLMLALGPISGIVSDKLGTRKWLIVFAMVGSAVMFSFGWNTSMTLVWVFIIAESFFAPCVTTGVMAIVPGLAKRPDKVGLGMAIIAFCKCIGIVGGSAIYGSVSASLGWFNASLMLLVPLAVLGAVLAATLIAEKRVRALEVAKSPA